MLIAVSWGAVTVEVFENVFVMVLVEYTIIRSLHLTPFTHEGLLGAGQIDMACVRWKTLLSRREERNDRLFVAAPGSVDCTGEKPEDVGTVVVPVDDVIIEVLVVVAVIVDVSAVIVSVSGTTVVAETVSCELSQLVSYHVTCIAPASPSYHCEIVLWEHLPALR